MTSKITRAKAEAALAAVEEQFRSYVEPTTYPAFTAADGTEFPAETLGPLAPKPTLVEDWNGGWAICWEDGPDDWAYRATMGGSSEEERVLVASAARENGVDPQTAVDRYVKDDEPVTWPKGVYAEPYYSFVLCLYPAT